MKSLGYIGGILFLAAAHLAVAEDESSVQYRYVLQEKFIFECQALADEGADVAVDGIVAFVSALAPRRFVIVSPVRPLRAGIEVIAPDGMLMPAIGTSVAVKGKAEWLDKRAVVAAREVEELSFAFIPSFPDVRQVELRRGFLNGRIVQITGIVRDVKIEESKYGLVTHLFVAMYSYNADVIVPGALRRRDYIDESVRLTGLVRGVNDDSGAFLYPQLELPGAEAIVLLNEKRLSPGMFWAFAALGVTLGAAALVLGVLYLVSLARQRDMELISEERRRMAADLHDTAEQYLASIYLMISAANAYDVPVEAKNAIKAAQDMLAKAKSSIREAISDLRNSPVGPGALAAGLDELAASLAPGGIRVRTSIKALPPRLPERLQRDILLIMREAAANAVKHGCAKTIVIAAEAGKAGVRLLLANDGAPFVPETAPGPADGHFGLYGMRSRARRSGVGIAWKRRRHWSIVEITIPAKLLKRAKT